MYFEPMVETESNTTPFFLAGGALLLIAALLLFSGGQAGEEQSVDSAAPPSAGGGNGGGGGGAVSLIPGAPVPVGEGGSPISDAPAVTIIQDVRETMNRLPLERNNPEVYDPPQRPRPRPRGG